MRAIAIDGPAGAGKSTIARRVAEKLGARYIDTGALYRAIAYKALRRGVSTDDEGALERLLAETAIEVNGSGGVTQVLLDGQDVTASIRHPEVGAVVSEVARHPRVRAAVVSRLRAMAEGQEVVMDGRDIGTVVFPDASLKIFLTAALEERARRRYEELKAEGYAVTLDAVREELEARDRTDMTRETAPLAKAPDAVELDTTEMSIEETVDRIVALARADRSVANLPG
ncbi:MAG: (d)CMP kinase [Hydrogenibacillus sp.]|nr:(d)CMP kinase [Hydrogenibacillus sp.]